MSVSVRSVGVKLTPVKKFVFRSFNGKEGALKFSEFLWKNT